MRILRATHLGMCFGVRDAIQLALTTARHEPLTILGDLVHNETVVRTLESRGVRTVHDPAQIPTPTVLITAHGTAASVVRHLEQAGRNVLEATCPLVHRAHHALEQLVAEQRHPVVIGRADHVEVRGLTRDLPDFDVVLSEADIDALRSRSRYGVVAQTTQPIQRVQALVAYLQARFPHADVRFIDTVCQPTKQRQAAAVALAQQCDVVVVVGGPRSNNTRELAQTCLQHGARVVQVQNALELQPEWFGEAETIGLTAGTSTPDPIIEAVEQWLLHLAALRNTAACPAPPAHRRPTVSEPIHQAEPAGHTADR